MVTTMSFGSIGIIGGLLTGAFLAGGPQTLVFRASVFTFLCVITNSCPSESRPTRNWGLFGLFVMLAMITEVPGSSKTFGRSPAFMKLITETLNARAYYKKAELRGNLAGIKPGRVMYAVHPHGVLTAGWTWNMFFNTDFHKRAGKVGFLLDEGLRLKSPTFRLMCDACTSDIQWSGPATKKVMNAVMAKGDTSLALLPGGFQEATLCTRGVDRVYAKNRKGFVKYCLSNGYDIQPCYTFGESDTYSCFPYLLKARLALAKQNIPAAAMFGAWWCPILPRPDAELLTYVGDR